AKTLYQDFWIHNLVNKPVLLVTPACKKWEKPPCSFAKINFDATVSNNKISYGVIVRDSDGFVLGRVGGFKDKEILVKKHGKDITIMGYRIDVACKHMDNFNSIVIWANRSCNKSGQQVCQKSSEKVDFRLRPVNMEIRRRLCGIAKGGDCPEYLGRNNPLGTANKLEYFKKTGLKRVSTLGLHYEYEFTRKKRCADSLSQYENFVWRSGWFKRIEEWIHNYS
ncbi:hypothetical protein Goshw_010775, partial [Gossypium schwendimanii]|nr:hypothetical protein [Gossypium schwendimanii]